jgi:rhodanese-related sulfurtransferase
MSVTNIDCATLKKWLKNDEAVLIDVRELAEYQESKIERAHLIPLGEISINSLPDFKNKKLVLHCRSGKRSLTAGTKLLEENPKLEIYNLEGGIIAWNNCTF